MPAEDRVGRILRLSGYGTFQTEFDEATSTATLWVRRAASDAFYTCSGCGIGVRQTHGMVRERRVRDLPWGAWKVWLVVEVHRVRCRRCGVKMERLEFLEGKHPYTRRFSGAGLRGRGRESGGEQVASKWGLSAQTVRRIDKRSLAAWSASRKRRPLRQMEVDELFWRKGKCLTIVSALTRMGPPLFTSIPPGVPRVTLV